MPPQEELFYDDEHHALRRTIEEGKGYKKTAAQLWPDMKVESAYAKLKHAVNGTNGESLKFGQVILVCTFNERYDALFFFADRCMHERPARKVARDEVRRLAGIIEAAGETLRHAAAALEEVRKQEQQQPVVRAVS